jgi:hypothetical protein
LFLSFLAAKDPRWLVDLDFLKWSVQQHDAAAVQVAANSRPVIHFLCWNVER